MLAVGGDLTLPDRDPVLDALEPVAAGVERGRPVRGAGGDEDGVVADGELAGGVQEREPVEVGVLGDQLGGDVVSTFSAISG
jgi:hypothetical protein